MRHLDNIISLQVLCITSYVDTSPEQPHRALDHGLEHIVVPFNECGHRIDLKPKREAKNVQPGGWLLGQDEDDDAVGIPRVYEALESNMWPVLTRKEVSFGVGNARLSDQTDNSDGGDEDESSAVEETQHTDVDAEVAPSPPEATGGVNASDDANASREQKPADLGENATVPPTIPVVDATEGRKEKEADEVRGNAVGDAVGDHGDLDEEQELELEQFGALLEKMQNLRANSANLSDGERRRRAEEAIMQLLAMEGIDGDDL